MKLAAALALVGAMTLTGCSSAGPAVVEPTGDSTPAATSEQPPPEEQTAAGSRTPPPLGGGAAPNGTGTSGPTEPIDLPASNGELGSILVVGDSLTVGGNDDLERQLTQAGFGPVTIDAEIGRGVDTGIGIVADKRRDGALADTVVIALGTNNLGADSSDVTAWLQQARQAAGAEPRIMWVNLLVADERADSAQAISDALSEAGAYWRIYIADWANNADNIVFYQDGIHLPPEATSARNTFITRAAVTLAATL